MDSATAQRSLASRRGPLLRFADLRAALEQTSYQRVREVQEESPVLRRMENLSGRAMPLPREEVAALLGQPVPAEQEGLPADGNLVLEELQGLGGLRLLPDGQVDVADLYRHGYGIHRRGPETRAQPGPTQTAAWVHIGQAEALVEQGLREDGTAAEALYQQAARAYDEALGHEPDLESAITGLATALILRAEHLRAGRAKLRAEASAHLQALRQRRPESLDARFWILIIRLEEARELPGEEAAALLGPLVIELETAFRSTSTFDFLLVGALSQQASLIPSPDAVPIFARAEEVCRATTQTQRAGLLSDECEILLERARRETGPTRDATLDIAIERAQQALQREPDSANALNLWGTALRERASFRLGDEADRLLEQAIARFEMALLHRFCMVRSHLLISAARWDRSLLAHSPLAATYLAQAQEHIEAALAIAPDAPDAHCRLGDILRSRASAASAGDRETLRAAARQSYEEALVIYPASTGAQEGLGLLALHTDRPEEARTWAARAETARPGAGASILARLAALADDEEGCRTALARAFSYGRLPSLAAVLQDPLLSRYRDRPWFVDYPARLGAE